MDSAAARYLRTTSIRSFATHGVRLRRKGYGIAGHAAACQCFCWLRDARFLAVAEFFETKLPFFGLGAIILFKTAAADGLGLVSTLAKKTAWAKELREHRPDVSMETIEKYLHNLYRDISEILQATLPAKHHFHLRPFPKSVQNVPPRRGFAGLTRERAWSTLAGLYEIAANLFPGPRLNTKSVPQGMQTNQHHARSMLHPRARAWRQVWWLTVSSPLHQADASVAVGRSIRRRRKCLSEEYLNHMNHL